MEKSANTEKEVSRATRGSGNVFADLGLSNPEDRLARAGLVVQISRLMREQGIAQSALARQIGVDQPAVSRLLRGQTAGYTTDRLMRILNQLGQDIEITVRPAKGEPEHPGSIYIRLPEAAKTQPPAVRESKANYPAKGKK